MKTLLKLQFVTIDALGLTKQKCMRLAEEHRSLSYFSVYRYNLSHFVNFGTHKKNTAALRKSESFSVPHIHSTVSWCSREHALVSWILIFFK